MTFQDFWMMLPIFIIVMLLSGRLAVFIDKRASLVFLGSVILVGKWMGRVFSDPRALVVSTREVAESIPPEIPMTALDFPVFLKDDLIKSTIFCSSWDGFMSGSFMDT